MAGPKPAMYASTVTAVGFVCLALSATAVGLPIWGYFEYIAGGWDSERGYFGPFRTCKKLNYGREVCGDFNFRPHVGVYISGVLAAMGCAFLGLFSILSVIQLSMISSRDKVVMSYKPLVIIKLVLAIISAILATVAAILFGWEIDNVDVVNRNYVLSRGVSFYLQVIVIVLTIILAVMSLFDILLARQPGGDPTMPVPIRGGPATTYNNPGFRERPTNGATVSVTDASGRPYGGFVNGSMASMNTTLTSVSNGSTVDGSVTRSPLRSSLKKPKPKDGLGIQNPGYSGSSHSPTMNRNGSMKKVRIQTHSTEV